jgi:membrane fusion protein (multidrug efflux system)
MAQNDDRPRGGKIPDPDALDRWADQSRRDGQNGDADDEDDDAGDAGGAAKKKRGLFQSIWVKLAIALVVLALIAGGIVWWLISRQYEDTDDAFIDTHIVHISPQVAGQVISVRVNDNQEVRRGQPLVELSSADSQTKYMQAKAQEAQALTQVAQARASEAGAAAQEAGAAAQDASAMRDLARYRQLQQTAPQAVAQQQVDQARATAENASAQRRAAQAQIAGAQAQIANAKAQIKVIESQIAAADLLLSYAHIVAPVDGHVTQRSVAPGNYVTPGEELMAIVPDQLWVTANFKETQLAHMRVGQPVTLSIDACAGEDIRGHVDSIQRGAGQAFGILPPENATGNYVKVVQRVPVKIALDRVPKDCVLGPGMSVEPSVTVR